MHSDFDRVINDGIDARKVFPEISCPEPRLTQETREQEIARLLRVWYDVILRYDKTDYCLQRMQQRHRARTRERLVELLLDLPPEPVKRLHYRKAKTT